MTTLIRGCNLAGGDTPWATWSAGAVADWNYKFVSHADVDTLVAAGFNSFRLLFTWEAIQPKPMGDINANVGGHKAYADALYALVPYITGKGCSVLLDVHGGADTGFAAYYDVKVGGTYSGFPVASLLENLWLQVATKFKANDKVMYGVTNEPHDMNASVWYPAVQKVVTAIRTAGARGTIMCPGVDWTGAGTWTVNNGPAWNLVDPLNNLMPQLHLYFDSNSGGGTDEVVSGTIGVERVSKATAWARSKGLKLVLGEVALKATVLNGAAAWASLMAYLEANKDVWSGWYWWGGGPPAWWSGYRFAILSGTTTPTAQLKMVQPYLVAPVPVPVPVPVDPQIAALQAHVAALNSQIVVLTNQVTALKSLLAISTADVAAGKAALVVSNNALAAANAKIAAAKLALG